MDLAERQHGAISSAQLVRLGLGRSTIGDWVRDGRLHRRHQGVYALGQPRLSDEGRLWAAVLATNATLYGASSPGPGASWIRTKTRFTSSTARA